MQLFFREARLHPLLTRGEEVELANRIEGGDLEAKDRLVNSNLRLVVANAKRYQNQGLGFLDLIQDGTLCAGSRSEPSRVWPSDARSTRCARPPELRSGQTGRR